LSERIFGDRAGPYGRQGKYPNKLAETLQRIHVHLVTIKRLTITRKG
jgi:hypothetical protein